MKHHIDLRISYQELFISMNVGSIDMIRIRIRCHTVYGWSDYSPAVSLKTLPSLPSMNECPLATVDSLIPNGKNGSSYSVSCHLTWSPAMPNGSPIIHYLVQVKHTGDYSDQLIWINSHESFDSVSIKPGTRCQLHDSIHLAWICEVCDDKARILIDGERGFHWVEVSSLTPLSLPKQTPKLSYGIPIKDYLDHYSYNPDIHLPNKDIWSTIQTTDQLETTV